MHAEDPFLSTDTAAPAGSVPPLHTRWGRAWALTSLRWRLNLIVTGVLGGVVVALMVLQIDATRASVREEIGGSSRVAAQLLERVSWITARSGLPGMTAFLAQLGRVRANEITLVGDDGQLLYRSPPSSYKAGRSAPVWFADWVAPAPQVHEIRVAGGVLRVQADASRAVLDGWDELCQLAMSASLILAVVSAAVFWAVSRAVQPLGRIVQALTDLEQGHFHARLPPLPGAEAAMIGTAVNRLAEAIDTQLQARMQAFETQRQLAQSQEWAHRVEQRLESERKEIAAELHDEFGQSVTAIRTLARSVVLRLPEGDGSREALSLIDQEASRLYDAMHGLIPRLTPLTLGPLGLQDALADLVAGFRTRYRQWTFHAQFAALPMDCPLSTEVALAAYRVVQEAVTNAIKYSGGQNMEILLTCDDDQPDLALCVSVDDDGCGLPPAEQRPSRFGLLGLRERVSALGGVFEAVRRADRGTHVAARLPLRAALRPAA